MTESLNVSVWESIKLILKKMKNLMFSIDFGRFLINYILLHLYTFSFSTAHVRRRYCNIILVFYTMYIFLFVGVQVKFWVIHRKVYLNTNIELLLIFYFISFWLILNKNVNVNDFRKTYGISLSKLNMHTFDKNTILENNISDYHAVYRRTFKTSYFRLLSQTIV